MQIKSDWKDATCCCAVDMENDCRKALDGTKVTLIIVPTMEEGTFIIANVPLPKFVETVKSAVAQEDRV